MAKLSACFECIQSGEYEAKSDNSKEFVCTICPKNPNYEYETMAIVIKVALKQKA